MTDAATPATQSQPIPDYVRRLHDRVADREGFASGYTVRHEGHTSFEGFQGVMLRVRIDGHDQTTGQPKTLRLITKMTPRLKLRQEFFNTNTTFEHEIVAYERVLPAFARFQRECGLTADDPALFAAYPQCYGTHQDPAAGDMALVMSDQVHAGFRLITKGNIVDLAHARLLLAQLGRYHAVSLAMKRLQAASFAAFRQLQSSNIRQSIDNKYPVDGLISKAIGSLDAERDGPLVELLAYVRANFAALVVACTEGARSEDERFAVLIHGDCWSNNHMYRYANGDAAAEPTAVCIVDWQVMHFGNLALDVSFYLYCALEQRVRGPHYDELLAVYQAAMAETMRACGVTEPDEVCSLPDVHEQMRRYGRYGFAMATVLLPFIAAEPGAVMPDLDVLVEQMQSGELQSFDFYADAEDQVYRSRVRGVLEDFAARGLVLRDDDDQVVVG